MRRKRQKGYWLKKSERFSKGSKAKARAGYLREFEQIAHVIVEKSDNEYLVKYSVAKWYAEELERCQITL